MQGHVNLNEVMINEFWKKCQKCGYQMAKALIETTNFKQHFQFLEV